MKKLVLIVECGVGTRTEVAYLVPDDYTQDQLDDYAWDAAIDHAESYGIYLDDDEDSGDIEGWWEEYDSDTHDGHLIFGGNDSFEWNEI